MYEYQFVVELALVKNIWLCLFFTVEIWGEPHENCSDMYVARYLLIQFVIVLSSVKVTT